MTRAPATPPQLEKKSLQTFALHAIFLSVLLGLLPSLDSAYAYGFQAAGNGVFGSLGRGLRVEYHWAAPQERHRSGEIEMRGFVPSQAHPVWDGEYSVRDRGYIPTVVLLALIVVTPATRRRRVLGALLGAVALNAFYLCQTGVLAATLFAAVDPDLIALGDGLAAARPTVERLFGSVLPRYAAVFAVWVIAAAPTRGLDTSAVNEWLPGVMRAPRAR